MKKNNTKKPHLLYNRILHIPRMSVEGAQCMAAAFRAFGIKAQMSPDSDEETLALASRFTTGEECLPQRVVLGNFLKIVTAPGFNADEHAFLLPTSAGPCRFGQYMNLTKKVFSELNASNAVIFSPTSSDGYEGISGSSTHLQRTGWRALITADILRKLLFMFRPYEKEEGSADMLQEEALSDICGILAEGSLSTKKQMEKLVSQLCGIRDKFLALPLKEKQGARPVVGVVGEIYLRFNTFSNQNLIRYIEKYGGEAWIAGIAEWVWYTNAEEKRKLREAGRAFSSEMIKAKIRHHIQHMDETALIRPFRRLFLNRKDESVEEILRCSQPYLPANKALGEMVLNTGNAIAFFNAGCSGVVDISPFTCMNGIVSEVVYPRMSEKTGGLPIRIFYFDGVPVDLNRDVEIFMDQVHLFKRKNYF